MLFGVAHQATQGVVIHGSKSQRVQVEDPFKQFIKFPVLEGDQFVQEKIGDISKHEGWRAIHGNKFLQQVGHSIRSLWLKGFRYGRNIHEVVRLKNKLGRVQGAIAVYLYFQKIHGYGP